MAVSSDLPTSRRGYLSQDELAQFADITINDTDEADDQINQAEELIDAFVGPQEKFYDDELVGKASAGGSTSLTFQTSHQNIYEADYFKLCEVEIVGGTGEGQRRKITASTKAGVLTVDSAWDTTPSTDSIYKIYQLGKYPRFKDVTFFTDATPYKYYKQIPEAVKRATAAQVEFMIEMGAEYFRGDDVTKNSESLGDYSYTKGEGATGVAHFIGPKAKLLLQGYINRTGRIV